MRKPKTSEQLYVYCWGNNPARARMKGRVCRVLARGAKNSVAIEFVDNGERTLTSRNALRRVSTDYADDADGRGQDEAGRRKSEGAVST